MNDKRKAGPITLALGLIVFGGILLFSNITGTGLFEAVYKYWPVMLIGLGVEYFVRLFFNRKNKIEDTRFHIPTLMLILFVSALGYVGQQVDSVLKANDLSGYITEALGGTNFNYQRNFESGPIELAPGGKIRFNAGRGSVALVPSTDDKFYVQARITGWGPTSEDARKRADSVRINIDKGTQVAVTYVPDRTENVRRPADVEFRVMVPHGANVIVETETGQIIGDNLEANLDARTNFGSIVLTAIKGNIDSSIGHGRAEFKNVEGNLNVDAESGSIKATDVTGKVKVRNDNGNAEVVSFRPVTTDYDVINRHGQILIRIPELSDVSVSAASQDGSVAGTLGLVAENLNTSGDNDQRGLKGTLTLGSGKGKINLSNETGSIIVDRN